MKALQHLSCTKSLQELTMIVVASPVPHPSHIEMPLGRQTFFSKHNLNMKFTYADEKWVSIKLSFFDFESVLNFCLSRLADFLGWESKELIGQSVFEFYHALDNEALKKSYKSCEYILLFYFGYPFWMIVVSYELRESMNLLLKKIVIEPLSERSWMINYSMRCGSFDSKRVCTHLNLNVPIFGH